jgi:hypothetical protein
MVEVLKRQRYDTKQRTRQGGAGPGVHVMALPPLMANSPGWPTMQTTINTLFRNLFP